MIGPIESCYRVELEELIGKYSLHSTVCLMGFQTDEVLSRHLAMSDIFINLKAAVNGRRFCLFDA